MSLYLHSIGVFHPENKIDNKFLEDLDINTTNQWILERVGISSRRTVLPLDYIKHTKNIDPRMANEAACYTNAETARIAAETAISKLAINKNRIGMIIAGGCSFQYMCPSFACIVANQLNIEALCMDINSACTSLVAQIYFLSQMSHEILPEYILLVLTENTTRVVNYQDRNTAVLWGDGSTAIILSSHVKSRFCINNCVFNTNPNNWDKVVIPVYGYFNQDGSAVQTFAIKKHIDTIRVIRSRIQSKANIKFIGHQGNLIMLESIAKRAGIPTSLHYYNVNKFGNCGAAGAPSVLAEQLNALDNGDQIILAVAGAGLSWGGFCIDVLDNAT